MPILPKYRTEFTNKGEKEIYSLANKSGYFENNLKRYLFHSLRSHNVKRKLVGEVDFVYLDDNFILFLESKGGPVRYDSVNDEWWVLGGTKRGEPFKQVTDYLFHFRDNLINEFYPSENYRSKLIFGYGVMFPDVKSLSIKKKTGNSDNFSYETIEYDPEIIYTSTDHSTPNTFVKYIERLKEYWKSHDKYNNRTYSGIGLKGVDNIRKMFRRDLIFEIPLNKVVDDQNDKIIEYTEEQYQILDSVDFFSNRGFIVSGGPGTGKTLIAKELILRKANQNKKVAFFCFNKNLSSEIKKYFDSFEDLEIEVFSVHKYLFDYLNKASLLPEGNRSLTEYWTELLPNQFKYWYNSLNVSKYDFLIIDEGQDVFKENILDSIFLSLNGGIESGNWSIFIDYKFQGFYESFDEEFFKLFVSQYPTTVNALPLNCRNHQDIINVASRHSGLDIIPCRRKDVPFKTRTVFYKSTENLVTELDILINKQKKDGVDLSKITILTPDNAVLKNIIEKSKLGYNKVNEDNHKVKGKVSISTIHSYKGLENDFVIVAGVLNYSPEVLESMSLLYVGYTRAKLGLTIFFQEENKTKLAIQAMN
ncbi:3'-5' exonuclease [Rasiella sp. SM2506]|uniref:3'-5' exonuclease n=1 Tax=Rasiella sp. SM2506 TaxID=3423914 RepID=UPI003D7992F4